jgi:hypothetical protein
MKITVAVAIVLFVGLLHLPGAIAQNIESNQQKLVAQHASSAVSNDQAVRRIGFRLTQWRTVHGGDADVTQKMLKTLKQIGCEVEQKNHGNHVDLSFRCTLWKGINVNSDEQSQQWHNWLSNNGFETFVLNPSSDSQLTTVRFMSSQWKTFHTHDNQNAQTMKSLFEVIGCEVTTNNHGNHFDVRVRSPEWKMIGLSNSDYARSWQDFLNKSGFQTELPAGAVIK